MVKGKLSYTTLVGCGQRLMLGSKYVLLEDCPNRGNLISYDTYWTANDVVFCGVQRKRNPDPTGYTRICERCLVAKGIIW